MCTHCSRALEVGEGGLVEGGLVEGGLVEGRETVKSQTKSGTVS